MQSNNIRNLFGSTLTHKHVDCYICVCYHQNLTLHKDEVNNFPLFDDDKPNDHIDMKSKNKLVPNSQVKMKINFKKSTLSKSN